MLLPIRRLGDPVLRAPAKPVEHFDGTLRRLAKDMTETMYHAPGVGLAGPQVGVSLQLFVFDDGERGPSFLANPELYDGDGDVTEEEGCLSIPGPYHPTQRYGSIRCRGLDLKGNLTEVQGDGLPARGVRLKGKPGGGPGGRASGTHPAARTRLLARRALYRPPRRGRSTGRI